MEIYASAYCYLRTSTEELDKINKLKVIIAAHYDTLLSASGTANYDEYWIDDGQSKIKTKYRSQKDVLAGLDGLELTLDRMIVRYNKLNNGSVLRLMDSKNFNHSNRR